MLPIFPCIKVFFRQVHRKNAYNLVFSLVALVAILFAAYPARADYTVSHGPIFHRDGYDYGPSVIQQGHLQRLWWCGYGPIPGTHTSTDVIFYRTYNTKTGQFSAIAEVLWPTPGTWDGVFTCDPSVIGGSFVNPANGQTYALALYYTATDDPNGINNRIGLAYSNDGINWTKYAGNPVIYPQNYPTTSYGAGQAATYNGNGQAGLWVFHTDTSTGSGTRIWVRSTNDGIHFSAPTLISNQGLFLNQAMANSDFAYDSQSGQFYAALSLPGRGGDRETYHVGLYRMPASQLLSGQGTWETLGFIDSNLTGSYLNHSPGLLRDFYGNVTPFLPAITTFFAEGTNDPGTWDLAKVKWRPNPPTLAFNRYDYPGVGHWVTSGYIGPGYHLESTLGYLYMVLQQNTAALYGCRAGASDYFVSPDPNCENQFILGINGWIYSSQPPGISTVALYRCYSGKDHFVSPDPNCEGTKTEFLLGYAKTQP